MKEYALITGACSGLGKAFALQMAMRGYALLLIDVPGAPGNALASALQSHFQTEVLFFEADLSQRDDLEEKMEAIAHDFSISVLINNAGIGGTCAITETSCERIDQIIALNIRGTALLTRIFVPKLMAKKKGFILNVSSIAAFTPIAYKNVYPASKAFISSFSLGLREELSHTGVSVSVLYPGSMMTNFSVSRRILSLGSKGRMGLLSTDAIAAEGIRQLFRKKAIIIPGGINRFNCRIMKWLPVHFKMRLISREVNKEIQMIPSY